MNPIISSGFQLAQRIAAVLALLAISVAESAGAPPGDDPAIKLDAPLDAFLNFKDMIAKGDAAVLEKLKEAFQLFRSGKFAESISKAEAASASSPNSSIPHVLIGVSRIKLGDFDEGIKSLLTAVRIAPDKFNPLIATGNAYLMHGDLEQARKYFQMILDKKADQPEGHQGLGLVCVREEKWDEAAAHFEAGIVGMPPTAYGIKVNLAALYNRQRKFEKTIALLGELVKKVPGNDAAAEFLGAAYLAEGKAPEAIETYQRAFAASPTATLALGLGVSYRQSNQLEESLKYLKEATLMGASWDEPWIQLAHTQLAVSDFPGALASLDRAKLGAVDPATVDTQIGEVYLVQKDFSKAIAIFEQIVAAKKGDASALDHLGTAYQVKGDIEAAERTFKEAAKRFPKAPLPPYRLGILFSQAGRHQEAIAELEKAVALDPDNVPGQRALSIACNKAGETGRAVSIAERLVEKNPGAIEPKLFLAATFTGANDQTRANAIYQAVLKENPKHIVALNNLALGLAGTGEFDEALRLAREAVALLPESGQILDTLGWISYLQGDIGAATESLTKAAKLSPNDPSIQYHLGMAHWKQNQKAPALESFKRAVALSKDFPEYKAVMEMIESEGKSSK